MLCSVYPLGDLPLLYTVYTIHIYKAQGRGIIDVLRERGRMGLDKGLKG